MSEQTQLDFTVKQTLPPEVRERIADGMKRAEDHAEPSWKRAVHSCIVAVARRQKEVVVDDVLEEMDGIRRDYLRRALSKPDGEIRELEELAVQRAIHIPDNLPPTTHNFSALGPAMKRAASDGVLARTDRTRRSKREGKNGNLQFVWISNYYGAQ